MTAQTQMYVFNQRRNVVLLQLQTRITRRYEKVYAKELTINRGVDNIIEFAFINQEQKPVNINNKDITCRILNANGTEILLQKTLVPIYPITGITSLQLTIADIQNIPPQKCFYSLEIPEGSFDYPVFVDEDSGARGVMNIVNSVLPAFVPSRIITIGSHLPPKFNDSVTYYSSTINTLSSPVITIQNFYQEFTGNIQFQGSTLSDFSIYYDITDPYYYVDKSGTEGFTIDGYHPFIRIKIVNDGTEPADTNGDLSGDLVKILAR